MEELMGDLEYELHWKILQIAEKDEKVKIYIQDKKEQEQKNTVLFYLDGKNT